MRTGGLPSPDPRSEDGPLLVEVSGRGGGAGGGGGGGCGGRLPGAEALGGSEPIRLAVVTGAVRIEEEQWTNFSPSFR